MFCPNCGYENDDDSLFCEKCGAAFNNRHKHRSCYSQKDHHEII